MSDERHFSTFEIDLAWAEGLASHPELEAHLVKCTDCTAYVDELRALDAMPAPAIRRRRSPRRWMAPGVATLALAAAVLLFLRQRPEQAGSNGAYVGVKGGAPASMLLLKRGEITRPWDGREPIRPGDVVAIHVACEGHPHVVVQAKDEGRWAQVAENECPREPGVLPFTLVVDERPGDEEVRVVFSPEQTFEFVLRKEVSR